MRALLVSLTLTAAALTAACATTDSAAPPEPSRPAVSTPPTTPPATATTTTSPPVTALPSLPPVRQAEVTITKTTPKPPPGVPCGGGADACIDLSANRSWLLDDGEIAYGPVPITHGRPGYLTPPGTFTVDWKNIDHRSSLFDDAPMPYSVFFNGGIAFHEGSLNQLSHGCIHLSNEAARTYFEALAVGDVVQVVP